MKKFAERLCFGLEKTYTYAVWVPFLMIIIYLTALAGFATCYISTTTMEHTWFAPDSILLNLAVMIAAAVCLVLFTRTKLFADMRERLSWDRWLFHSIKMGLLCCIFGLGVFIVLSLRLSPQADQLYIVRIGQELARGDISSFQLGEYGQKYQHQIGIILFFKLYATIFGEDNFIVFQLINCLGLALVYNELSMIAKRLGLGQLTQLAVLVFGLFFLPFTLYVTFIYGTVLGFAAALGAVRFEIQFLQKGGLKNALLCALLAAVAYLLKSNFLIFVLAMVICALVNFLKDHSIRQPVLVALILLFCIGQSKLTVGYINANKAAPLKSGCSSWSFLAMGMQDGPRAAGWYTGYNAKSFKDSGNNTQKQAAASKAYIKERLSYFWAHKGVMLRFYGEKNASQWNNPTWQGPWVVTASYSEATQPKWASILYTYKGQRYFSAVYNIVQFLFLFGVLFFLLLDRKNRRREEFLLLEMIFLGGFLFHTIWEAKSQYTVVYFLCALPLAIRGWTVMCQKVHETVTAGRSFYKRGLPWLALSVAAVSIALCFTNDKVTQAFIKIDKADDRYQVYYDMHQSQLPSGEYRITPSGLKNKYLNMMWEKGERDGTIVLKKERMATVSVKTEMGESTVYFPEGYTVLSTPQLREKDKMSVRAISYANNWGQRWYFRKVGKLWAIMIGEDKALTYHPKKGYFRVEKFTGTGNQLFTITEQPHFVVNHL